MKTKLLFLKCIFTILIIMNSGYAPGQWFDTGQLNNTSDFPFISVVDSNVV